MHRLPALARAWLNETIHWRNVGGMNNTCLSQVERDFNREQEKAAQKAEKDAAKAQRHQ